MYTELRVDISHKGRGISDLFSEIRTNIGWDIILWSQTLIHFTSANQYFTHSFTANKLTQTQNESSIVLFIQLLMSKTSQHIPRLVRRG